MNGVKIRDIVEVVALHGLCTQFYGSSDATVESIVRNAKQISNDWAKLNPEICDKE